MFERFTDRCRKVMALANQQSLRWQHEYIGTEHLLFALVEEGSGTGVTALKNLGVDIEALKAEIERVIRVGTGDATVSKLPQTPRAKKSN